MTGLVTWQLALGLSLLCGVAGALMLPAAQRSARVESRIRSVSMPADSREEVIDNQVPIWMRLLGAVGQAVLSSGILSQKAIEDLRQTVTAAGHRTGPALSLFVGAKLVLLVGLPLLAWLVMSTTGLHLRVPLVMGGCAVVGLMAPDYVVRSIRRRYLNAVEVGLPAALDLLIICAEAGLALEAGLERVAFEAREGAEATANELRITASEMKILADRRQALTNMGKRTGLDSMSRLGGTLAQSLKYGTPLTQALRALAVEMRHIMLTRFEARAARIPVLLTLPMVLFILPCIFVVVAGPAAVGVMHMMASR
jgi:tight adherence protein C